MASDKSLMRLFISCPDTIRNLVITDNQLALVKYVRDCGYPNVCAAEVASLKDISVPNASRQLAQLWLRGYLKRQEYVDATGGIYYRYSVAF